MELGRNEIFPREREYLTVEIVNSSGYKKQSAKPPTPICFIHILLLNQFIINERSNVRDIGLTNYLNIGISK